MSCELYIWRAIFFIKFDRGDVPEKMTNGKYSKNFIFFINMPKENMSGKNVSLMGKYTDREIMPGKIMPGEIRRRKYCHGK